MRRVFDAVRVQCGLHGRSGRDPGGDDLRRARWKVGTPTDSLGPNGGPGHRPMLNPYDIWPGKSGLPAGAYRGPAMAVFVPTGI